MVMALRSFYFVILMVVGLQLKGQDYFRQIAIGASVGVTKALSGASVNKMNIGYAGSIGYYPTPDFNLTLEAQMGRLTGLPSPATAYKNKKTFTNNYQSVFITGNVGAASFYDDPEYGAAKIISRLHFGGGIGLMNSKVSRIDQSTLQFLPEQTHSNLLVPVSIGYEFNALSKDEIPLLKVDLSYSINFTGRGIDGYYDTPFVTIYYYAYASICVKYAVRMGLPRHKQYIDN
jgi:hypothetical protein